MQKIYLVNLKYPLVLLFKIILFAKNLCRQDIFNKYALAKLAFFVLFFLQTELF